MNKKNTFLLWILLWSTQFTYAQEFYADSNVSKQSPTPSTCPDHSPCSLEDAISAANTYAGNNNATANINLLEQTYIVDEIIVLSPGVSLIGQGSSKTILSPGNMSLYTGSGLDTNGIPSEIIDQFGSNSASVGRLFDEMLIYVEQAGTFTLSQSLKGFKIEGDRSKIEAGIVITKSDVTLDDVSIQNTLRTGIRLGNRNALVQNVEIKNCRLVSCSNTSFSGPNPTSWGALMLNYGMKNVSVHHNLIQEGDGKTEQDRIEAEGNQTLSWGFGIKADARFARQNGNDGDITDDLFEDLKIYSNDIRSGDFGFVGSNNFSIEIFGATKDQDCDKEATFCRGCEIFDNQLRYASIVLADVSGCYPNLLSTPGKDDWSI
ncbi:MAG: hypothetical protein AAFU64_15645, partial [Bacteroidota bacterium]